MASPSERSSSSRSSATLMPGRVVIVCDATKNLRSPELKHIIANIQMRENMIQEVDTITVLGILHKVLHPMGFEMQIGPDSFIGTRVRAIKEEVSRMVDSYVRMLQHSAEECEGRGVIIEVKIVVGAPLKKVVVQEVVASNATWVVLNRHIKKELRFYLKHIPCKVAMTLDNFSLDVLRSYYYDKATANAEHESFYSLSKFVPLLPSKYNMNNEQSFISPSYRGSLSSHESSDSEKSSSTSSLTSKSKEQSLFSPDEFGTNPQLEKSGSYAKDRKIDNSHDVMQKRSPQSESDFPFLYNANEMKPELDSRALKYSEIQIATGGFSSANLRGEGAYGVVYKGPDSDSTCLLTSTDLKFKVDGKSDDSYAKLQKQRSLKLDSDASYPSDAVKKRLDFKGFDYSEIQIATNDFSSDNLLGEDGYGVVYKGRLKDGQLIAVKVQKEANTQGFSEFYSQVCALSLACHKNIVMLLGYCRRENVNILVYEYICNKSLEWHLFDNTEHVLEWHRRQAIAIGIAKGLRFLHEECRGSPIIHRDMRPSNIFLTHEFVPLLEDCGIAKWNTNKHDRQTKIIGSLEYLAPEYAENGTCSVKTDVFVFGIILIQLISGRERVDPISDNHHRSLRQWAMPLIHTLALDELVDPRLGDSYSTYELYQMAKVAFSCIQTKPSTRPTIGEVLHILEGKNEHLNHLTEQFIPHNVQKKVYPQALED